LLLLANEKPTKKSVGFFYWYFFVCLFKVFSGAATSGAMLPSSVGSRMVEYLR